MKIDCPGCGKPMNASASYCSDECFEKMNGEEPVLYEETDEEEN